MRRKDEPNRVPRSARLSPAARHRLRISMAEAAQRARSEVDLTRRINPRVRRGPRPEMEVHASLDFVPMKEETAKDLGRSKDPHKARRPAEALKVGRDEIEALRKAEPRVLAWLAKKKQNAVLFMADPLKALQEAGIKLGPDELLRLRLVRQRNLAAAPAAPSNPITSIKVSTRGR
ncbi:MAG: hypothetical protein KDD47_02390 [Acidobacteria bacterium]|nr:hypothetical protein [Acidobacteriota bacterium]